MKKVSATGLDTLRAERALLLISIVFLWLSFQTPASGAVLEIKQPFILAGETLLVQLTAGPGTAATVQFLGQKTPMFPSSSKSGIIFRGRIGIPGATPTGPKPLTVILKTKTGEKLFTKQVEVKGGPPPQIVHLNVPSLNAQGLETLSKETQQLKKMGRSINKIRMWRGLFVLPAAGRISGVYGEKRVYNKNLASWAHRGVDIAAVKGTPVKAANRGKVVLSEKLAEHGNTVVVDHGQGICTLYLHLGKLNVKEGQPLAKGQILGWMGASGISTGSHLHWGLQVNGIAVNPVQWMEQLIL